MEFRILGPLDVVEDGVSLPIGAAKHRALLAIFLLHPNEVVSTDRLIEELWGEASPASATNALQVYVSQLRKALRGVGSLPESDDRLTTRSPGYSLRVSTDELDVSRFERLAEEGRAALEGGDESVASERFAEALGLVGGSPLMDMRFETFAQEAIERLEEQILRVREDRIEADLGLGRHDGSLHEIESLVRDHPFRERLREYLMLALYRSGRQAEALETYRQMREALADELGIDPTLRLQRLNEQILRQDKALELTIKGDEPDILDVSGRLPLRLSSFVGREELVALAIKRLGDERLVTLTGAGGIGKTRTSLQIADRLVTEGWIASFVKLSSVRQDPLVEDAVLRSLGVTSRGEEGLDAAARALRLHRSLIVLDNCEHVLEGAASIALRLLAEVPELRILATSRVQVGIQGEVTLQVSPLAVPEAAFELAETSEAVRLFVDRATAASPTFALDETSIQSVVWICERVGGLPLGIELAAARVRSFSTGEIAELLVDGPNLLAAGSEGGRHATMTATIDWSLELLADDERCLFERLGVFHGPFALDAAQSVAGAPPLGTDLVPILISRLVDKSLLLAEPGQPETSFRLLEPIRQRAATLLRDGSESDELASRLARWIVDLTEQAEPELRGADQERWHSRLTATLPEIRVSLEWATRQGQPGIAARIMGAMWLYMFINPGGSGEWRRWAELLCERRDLAPHEEALSRISATCQAFLDYDLDSVERHARAALTIAEPPTLAYFVASLSLGTLLRERGAYDDAIHVHRQAEAAARTSGDEWFEARSIYSVGLVELYRGDVQVARDHFERALKIFTSLGAIESVMGTYDYLYRIAADLGDDQDANKAIAEIEHLATRAMPPSTVTTLAVRAMGAIDRGDHYGGLAIALDGFEEAIKLGDQHTAADALDVGANALVALGRPEMGVSIIAAAEAMYPLEERWGTPPRWNRRQEAMLIDSREALGTETFSRAWARGRDTPVERLLQDI